MKGREKESLGGSVEEIVLDILTREAEISGLKVPIHVSKEEGDGLGYDTRSWDKDGHEVHIEVRSVKVC